MPPCPSSASKAKWRGHGSSREGKNEERPAKPGPSPSLSPRRVAPHVPPAPLRDGAIIQALCALHHIGPYERAYRRVCLRL